MTILSPQLVISLAVCRFLFFCTHFLLACWRDVGGIPPPPPPTDSPPWSVSLESFPVSSPFFGTFFPSSIPLSVTVQSLPPSRAALRLPHRPGNNPKFRYPFPPFCCGLTRRSFTLPAPGNSPPLGIFEERWFSSFFLSDFSLRRCQPSITRPT